MKKDNEELYASQQESNSEISNNGALNKSDMPGIAKDREIMGDFITLDLPDVKDIPGQEHIIPPRMDSFADTTISSDDEEGEGIFGDEEGD